jgi:hypothetical protein
MVGMHYNCTNMFGLDTKYYECALGGVFVSKIVQCIIGVRLRGRVQPPPLSRPMFTLFEHMYDSVRACSGVLNNEERSSLIQKETKHIRFSITNLENWVSNAILHFSLK